MYSGIEREISGGSGTLHSEMKMQSECTGCAWLAEEIQQRRDLIVRFQSVNDVAMIQLARDGIASLYRDWRAHAQYHHAGDPVRRLVPCIFQNAARSGPLLVHE